MQQPRLRLRDLCGEKTPTWELDTVRFQAWLLVSEVVRFRLRWPAVCDMLFMLLLVV